MTDIMLVSENEVLHMTPYGNDLVAITLNDGHNYMADWINGLLKRGYVVVNSFVDYRNLLVLRMERKAK